MYHINDDGDVGTCRAKQGKCPFGSLDQHFTTKEAARAFYETQQAKPKITSARAVGEPFTYDFPERNLALAKDSIAKANKRLEKAGLDERFTYTLEHYIDTSDDRIGGTQLYVPRVKMTVNTPSIKFDDYLFLAAVEKADAGFVVKTATGVDLAGYTPDNLKCEACGKAIGRQKTYLIEDKDGRVIQVGSSCVKNYFGVEPKGLWALTYEPLARAEANDSWGARTNIFDSAIPTEEVLAWALAVSEGGEKFVSGSSARNWGTSSTAETVRSAMNSSDTKWTQKVYEDSRKYLPEARRIVEILKKSDQSTDFGRNLATIASGEHTRWQHMNILVGGLSVLAREKRAAAKAAHNEKWGAPAKGYMGSVGDDIKGRKLKVYSVNHTVETDPYSYYGGEREKTRVTLRDEDNHVVVWWANKRVDVEPETELTMLGGKIKKHGEFNGDDQTTIGGRVRFEDPVTDEVDS